MKLGELADLIGGRISGNPDVEITGVSGIREAKEGDITFLLSKRYLNEISNLNALAVIVKEEIKELSVNMLIVDNPQFAFDKEPNGQHDTQ